MTAPRGPRLPVPPSLHHAGVVTAPGSLRVTLPIEHLELDAVRVLEGEHGSVLAIGDRGVRDAEALEVRLPLLERGAVVDLEPHVVEPGSPRIERLALVGVVLLELDDRCRRRV